jgi:effector-binding domain-containing protein
MKTLLKINIKKPSIKWISLITICLVFSLFAGISLAIEEPKYTVIKSSDDIQLRAYQPKIIAEVQIDGDIKQASNKGFRLIADYIFGNNTTPNGDAGKISMTAPVTMENQQQSEKISMTAPVTMEKQSKQNSNQWLMHFVMPSEYNLETLPKPNNPRVKIRQIADKNYAVIKFSGFTGEKKVEEKTKLLLSWMQENGLQPKGQPELARYNPPITPPFFRRNEVMIAY